jgi:universal stress protein E
MPFKDILVDVDATAPRHPALHQALDLARRARGRVTVVDVVEEVPRLARSYLSERLEDEIVRHRHARLAAAAARVRTGGVQVEARVLRGRAGVALIEEVLRRGQDLVIRSHLRDRAARGGPFGAVDMRLLRECPCPVWLLGGPSGRRPRRVIAAVHPDQEDRVGQALNVRIVEAAREVADLEHGSLTLVTAWSTFGERLLKARMSRKELREFVRSAHDAASAEMEVLVAALRPLGHRWHVELVRGQPEAALPRYAARHHTDLVVMGTVARSGLRGLIIGNTAEHVLGRLRCAVLALKPEGFVSPVTLTRG